MSRAVQVLPPAFVERFRAIYPGRDGEQGLAAFEKARLPSFRVNTLKTTTRALRLRLESQGFKLEAFPYPPGCFLLKNRRQRDLEETESYRSGELYMQNPSSMVPPHLLSPAPGMSVLDMAAAPGGKTSQMAALMENTGVLTAFEENPVRAEKLKANLKRQGVTFARVEVGDGAVLAKKAPEAYDRVLLDAPCSAEGRFQTGDHASFGYWKEETPSKCAKLQRRLFRAAFEALKPGGVLSYSTCAIAPEENEGVLDWAMEHFEGRLEICPLRAPIANARPGISAWRGKRFQEGVSGALRFIPTQVFEGFFCAILRKRAHPRSGA